MQINKKAFAAAVAGLILFASAGAASAAPAIASANVNVRSGPGGGYAAVDVLRRGDRVDVQQCRGGWCYVEKRGPDGWVSANYLNGRGGHGGGTVVRPGVSIEFNFGNPTPQRPQPPRPPRPDHGGWNGGHHDGGWDGGHGGWNDDWDRDDRPRRPRDWDYSGW